MDDSTIQILNTLITVFGILIGAVIGIMGTIYVQNKVVEREERDSYKFMLKERKDDLIIPLFKVIQEVWSDIAQYSADMNFSDSKQIEESRRELWNTFSKFKDFVGINYDDMSFLLPSPFPWIFMPLYELIDAIIIETSVNDEFTEKSTKAVNALMSIQEDIKYLMGLSVNKKMKTKYPI